MGEIPLLLQRQDRDKLGVLHDRLLKGEIESYVVVSVAADGTTQVDFDLHDANGRAGLNKMGGGLRAAHEHLTRLAVEMERKAQLDRALEAAGETVPERLN